MVCILTSACLYVPGNMALPTHRDWHKITAEEGQCWPVLPGAAGRAPAAGPGHGAEPGLHDFPLSRVIPADSPWANSRDRQGDPSRVTPCPTAAPVSQGCAGDLGGGEEQPRGDVLVTPRGHVPTRSTEITPPRL